MHLQFFLFNSVTGMIAPTEKKIDCIEIRGRIKYVFSTNIKGDREIQGVAIN